MGCRRYQIDQEFTIQNHAMKSSWLQNDFRMIAKGPKKWNIQVNIMLVLLMAGDNISLI